MCVLQVGRRFSSAPKHSDGWIRESSGEEVTWVVSNDLNTEKISPGQKLEFQVDRTDADKQTITVTNVSPEAGTGTGTGTEEQPKVLHVFECNNSHATMVNWYPALAMRNKGAVSLVM
jgi:hypothetical protein